jgi:hypothetical protein
MGRMMDRKAFFDAIRAHIKLDQFAVDGINALLDQGQDLPLHHMANILAQVRRETGGLMGPIKETVMASHKDRNPSDAEVIRRLDNAFARGQLEWVRTPYWREGWFGRGQIQITHERNYRRFGVSKDQALELRHSARIAVVGMMDGMFTGRKLSDFSFPAALDALPAQNPRRIVNGVDGSDREVAASHRMFAAALERAGWGSTPRPVLFPPASPAVPASPLGIWASITAALSAILKGNRK